MFPAQLVSCVLYLTTGGGPTLIIDQTSSSAALGARGWAVRPVAGRLAAYPGDRLHGVLPGTDWLLEQTVRMCVSGCNNPWRPQPWCCGREGSEPLHAWQGRQAKTTLSA